MQRINHPVGNFKITILKKFSILINRVLIFFISFFLNIKKDESEIIISNAFFAPWKRDKEFIKIFEKIKKYTVIDVRRLYTLWYLSNQIKHINGHILDVGCLMGGAGFLISRANKKGKVFLIDTFEGYVDKERFYSKNIFIFQNLKIINKTKNKLKLKNKKILKGIFPDNFTYKFKNHKFKLCHLDVNTFLSTKKSFYFLEKKIVKGGIIVFDDYGIYGADGVKKFIDQIYYKFSKSFFFIKNFQGQCILIKK